VRRLPVLQNQDTDDAAAARRPRWQWVLIGAGLVITLFLPLSWTGWLIGFLVFRACDVVKPFPAGRAERLPGGFGVMCDDVLAGVWGYVIMRGLLWAFPGWL